VKRAVLLLAALGLAGCPLPQPLPDYPAGTITPPRILVQTVLPTSEAVIRVGTGCATSGTNEPSFEMTAQLFDQNNIEQVVARWFVNYDSADLQSQTPVGGDQQVPPSPDTTVFTRVLPDQPFGRAAGFHPFQWPPPQQTGTLVATPYNEPGTIRVVELLVSNSFKPEPSTPKYREPNPNFEVQLYRWVFLLVPGTENCGAHPLP
jgi:hypothetical protein